jgi:molybdopterin-guanine dinucleotide biosynthesis protein B
MHELIGEAEATLAALLERVSPCDLVLIEGFKGERHPKLEVFRRALGVAPLHPADPRIVAVASDQAFPAARVPVVDLNDVAAIAELVCASAEPLAAVVAALERSG